MLTMTESAPFTYILSLSSLSWVMMVMHFDSEVKGKFSRMSYSHSCVSTFFYSGCIYPCKRNVSSVIFGASKVNFFSVLFFNLIPMLSACITRAISSGLLASNCRSPFSFYTGVTLLQSRKDRIVSFAIIYWSSTSAVRFTFLRFSERGTTRLNGVASDFCYSSAAGYWRGFSWQPSLTARSRSPHVSSSYV